ncbi:MAG: BatD family protein [Desulfobacterales bacterium]|nr:BatD family protein [Desulfobacterales bacterium]
MKRVSFLILTGMMVGLVWVASAWAQSARAVVDTNRLRLGDSFVLEVEADFSGARVEMPELEGLRISPRGSQTSMQMINGTTTRKVTFRYLVSPLQKGRFTFPAIKVLGGKEPVYTQPLAIEVLGRDASSQADEPWRVSASVSNSSPYVGEPFVWTFRFQTAVRMQGGNLQRPSFDGFSSEEMGESRAFETVINGRRYIVHEVNVLLTPQKSGELTIEPAVLTASLEVGKRRRSSDPFFDDFFGSQALVKQKQLFTKPLAVKVKPLPAYTGEMPFSGLVGRFGLSATLEKETVAKGDPITLTVTIEGEGNIKDAGAPALPLPKGMKHYGDTPVEEISLGPSGWRGRKQFKTALVPLSPGVISLEPVRLVWFDPKVGRYVTSSSSSLSFVVEKRADEELVDAFQAVKTLPPLARKEAVKLKGLDILPVKVDADTILSEGPMGLGRFLAWLGGPVALFGVALLLIKRLTRSQGVSETLLKKAQAEIRTAESSTGDFDAYHKALHSALTLLLGAMAGRTMEGVTEDEIVKMVKNSTGDLGLAKASAAILTSVEAARYGGGARDDASRKEQVQVLKRLAKGMRS